MICVERTAFAIGAREAVRAEARVGRDAAAAVRAGFLAHRWRNSKKGVLFSVAH